MAEEKPSEESQRPVSKSEIPQGLTDKAKEALERVKESLTPIHKLDRQALAERDGLSEANPLHRRLLDAFEATSQYRQKVGEPIRYPKTPPFDQAKHSPTLELKTLQARMEADSIENRLINLYDVSNLAYYLARTYNIPRKEIAPLIQDQLGKIAWFFDLEVKPKEKQSSEL